MSITQRHDKPKGQEGKPLKLYVIIAVGIFLIGGTILYASLNPEFFRDSFPGYSVVGIILMLVVIIWLSVTTFLNWWKRR